MMQVTYYTEGFSPCLSHRLLSLPKPAKLTHN